MVESIRVLQVIHLHKLKLLILKMVNMLALIYTRIEKLVHYENHKYWYRSLLASVESFSEQMYML